MNLNYEKRIDFSNFILIQIDGDIQFIDKLIFSDEAWFSLSDDINSQNCRFWCQENPHQYIEVPLHDQRVMVWAAITSSSVIGSFFFESTVNQYTYLDVIVNKFIPQFKVLNQNQINQFIYQQDSARPHVTNVVLTKLKEFF